MTKYSTAPASMNDALTFVATASPPTTPNAAAAGVPLDHSCPRLHVSALRRIGQGLDWEVTGRLAAVMGSLKIEHSGGQNHAYDRIAIAERFNEAFGYRPW